jgi:hypothetical protein
MPPALQKSPSHRRDGGGLWGSAPAASISPPPFPNRLWTESPPGTQAGAHPGGSTRKKGGPGQVLGGSRASVGRGVRRLFSPSFVRRGAGRVTEVSRGGPVRLCTQRISRPRDGGRGRPFPSTAAPRMGPFGGATSEVGPQPHERGATKPSAATSGRPAHRPYRGRLK